MAKSHERKIVDVRDLFGEKKEKLDIPELISSSPPKPKAPTLGGWNGGLSSGALGDYKPKACAGTNDNVFFGGVPKESSAGRQKRDAPKIPVLVDLDVGINDQGINDYTGTSPSEEVTLNSPLPPPVGMTSTHDTPWSFGPSKTSTSTSSRDQLEPRGMSGQRRDGVGGGVKPVGSSSQQYTADGRGRSTQPHTGVGAVTAGGRVGGGQHSQQQRPKPDAADRLDVTGLMSSLSLGQKPGEGVGKPGGFNQGRNELKDKNHIFMDQSSSGVETDENITPEGTAVLSRAAALSKRPLPPLPTDEPPPPPPLPQPGSKMIQKQVNNNDIIHKPSSVVNNNNQGVDSSYHSEEASDAEDEGSDFYEDEVTLDFEDEDEDGLTAGNKRLIYQEYHGDDFGQFLNDEHNGEQGIAPRGKKKRIRRRKKKEVALSPVNSTASVSSGEATVNKKRTLKGRIAAVFMGNSNSSNQQENHSPNDPRRFDSGNTIHTFSFADSKIGNSLTRRAKDDHVNGVSGSDLAPCDAAYGGDRKWWKTDTLSARTLQSNSDVLLMPRRPGTEDASGNGTSNFSFKKSDSLTFDGDVINEENDGPDFESLRKSVIYGVTEDKKNRKGSIFHRLKKDTKSAVNGYRDNTVTNPLAGLQ